MKRSTVLRILGLLALASGALAAFVFLPIKSYLTDLVHLVQRLGWWGSLVFGLIYAVAGLVIPGSLLTLAAGFAFGLVLGTVVVSVSSVTTAVLAFWLGRTLARGWIENRVAARPRFRALDQAVAAHGLKIVFLTRLSPVFPFTLLNYAFGLTRVRFRDYLLASWLGMLPGTILYVYLGSAVHDVTRLAEGQKEPHPTEQVFFWVGLVVTLGVTVLFTRLARQALRQAVPDMDAKPQGARMTPALPMLPDDEFNRELVGHVHPPDWINPEPAGRHNLVVIGAGTAGLVSAAGAAGLGAKVALIERDFLGGDCLNVGCVPSKALIRAARAFADVRDAGAYGVAVSPGAAVDFPAVMERMRRLRASISPNDSAQRYRSLGVDVFFGSARFLGPDSIEVGGRTLSFARAIIATGARAARPDILGLAETGCLTNETVFTLVDLPRRLAVIGAGPIGCELSQAFARFGSAVTLIGNKAQVMPRDDPEAAGFVERALRRDGIALHLNTNVHHVERQNGDCVLQAEQGGKEITVLADAILVAAGRSPNVEGLNLEAAGVAFDPQKGVHVDDRLRTSNRRIFAAGDICSPFQFTHAADSMARIAIQNALFYPSARASRLVIPWCTYTDPEVAHVGLTEEEARRHGMDVQTFVEELTQVDRAILDGETEGFVKVHVRAGSDRIVGATLVARHAGDMIGTLVLAMTAGLGLGTVARTIFPYPTQAEAMKRVADAYNRTRLTPFVKGLFERWLRWRR